MENKDSLLIRKYMNLMESIDRKLINEDESLDEDLIASAARENKLIASELEGYLKTMMKDQKIAKELTKAGIRTSEELLTALKGNRLTSSLKGSLELSVLKSNTKNPKLIDLASENLVRNKAFDNKYAAEFAQGQPAYERALKQAGYSEDAITKIVQKKFNQIDPKTGKPYARPETINKQGISATNGPKPNVPPAPANTKNLWQKWGDKIREQISRKKSWKELVLWAAGAIGVGSAALWYMLHNSGEAKPKDTPPTPPVDDSAWSPCVQDFVKNKQGQIVTTKSGQVSVLVKPSEYPEGLKFYTNGRVMDIKTNEMGSWSCKNAKAVVAEDSNTASFSNINIKWDKDKKDSSSNSGNSTSKFHDCSTKDVNKENLEFGCKSPQIKEIQVCLGFEKRFQTGNFGPITMKAIGGNVITKEIYDNAKLNCKGQSTTTGDVKIDMKSPEADTAAPTDSEQPVQPNNNQSGENLSSGRLELFNTLIQNYGDGSKPKYPFIKNEGNRIKYKGLEPSSEDLSKLDSIMTVKGYTRIKQDKEKGYGTKYVWQKQ